MHHVSKNAVLATRPWSGTSADQRLRVLYSFPHDLGSPGIGTTALHQVQGLQSLGAQVTVCCGRDAHGLKDLDVIETMRALGMRIRRRLIGINRAYRWHDFQVARLLRYSRNQFDIVHAWPLGAKLTLSTARACRICSFLERPNAHTRFAYDVVRRECESLGLVLPAGHSHANNPKRLAVEEEEYQLASQLLCPSEFVRNSFLNHGFAADRLVVHQYGLDQLCFNSSAASREELPRRPFRLLFAARGEPRKGLHYALKAWHASGLSAFGEFLIYGDFVPGYQAALGVLLQHPSIRVMGFSNSIPSVMRSVHALVLPSVEEGSALVTYEARACGCVLLASDATGAHATHEIDALIHRAGDTAALADQLRRLATDHEYYEQLRERGVRTASELTWTAAAARLLHIYADGHRKAMQQGGCP